MKKFFADKSASHFKNSKKFLEFHKSTVKLQSDRSTETSIEQITDGERIAITKKDQVELFNVHFSTIQSFSYCNNDQSS